MKPLSILPALLIFVAWVALMAVSVEAVRALGAQAGGDFFFGDFHHPWRRQFNLDFAFHLLLFASWIFWRTRSKALGALLFLLSAFFGGMFNLMYVLVALILAKGNMRRLLLGAHADMSGAGRLN